MRNLSRPAQPQELTQWKAANPPRSNADEDVLPWSSLGQDAKVRAQAVLCHNQKHLCAYCESRIDAHPHSMKIEHWQDQDCYPQHRFNWRNWLATCWGGQRAPGQETQPEVMPYCEHARGNEELQLNPYSFTGDLPAQFSYDRDGQMTGLTDPAKADIEVLNLNHGRLKDNRQTVYETVRRRLTANGYKRSNLLAERAAWETLDGDGRLPPYITCALHHIDRWVRALPVV